MLPKELNYVNQNKGILFISFHVRALKNCSKCFLDGNMAYCLKQKSLNLMEPDLLIGYGLNTSIFLFIKTCKCLTTSYMYNGLQDGLILYSFS